MNRPVEFVIALIFLLCPLSVSFAQEAGQATVDTEHGVSSDALKNKDAAETLRSPQLKEQDRYTRLLKEYTESINNAKTDEERVQLRRKFDKETSEYRKSMAEDEAKQKKREIEKEKQALEREYNKKVRLEEQKHTSEMKRLERECRKVAVGIEQNWASMEPVKCQEKKSLENEYKRRLEFLKKDYEASLRALQSR